MFIHASGYDLLLNIPSCWTKQAQNRECTTSLCDISVYPTLTGKLPSWLSNETREVSCCFLMIYLAST